MSSDNKIVIQEHQKDHTYNLWKILQQRDCCIDGSPTGSGKTFVNLYLARRFKLPIYVICPTDVISTWSKLADKHDIKFLDAITYQSLSSKKGKQPKHGLLTRRDYVVNKKEYTEYKATSSLVELIKSGVFFIFDEAQKLKNNSMQTGACIEITSTIFELKKKDPSIKTKFSLLSATLFDKEEHCVQTLKLIGVLNKDYIVDKFDSVMFKEFVENIKKISGDDSAKENIRDISFDRAKSAQKFFYGVYINLIKKYYSSSMDSPKYEIKEKYFNSFYYSSKKYQEEISDVVEKFAEKVNHGLTESEIRAKRKAAASSGIEIGSLTKFLVELEFLKLEIFSRVGKNILENNKNSKLVVCLYYLKHMEYLAQMLKKYNPLIYNGGKTVVEREKIKNLFNADNDDYRVVIMNSDISVGVNFHDTYGNRPRFMLLNPSYKVISIKQSIGRITRFGVKSDTSAEIIYSISGLKEKDIMQAIWQKSKILSEVHEEQVESGTIFPGDFEAVYEKTPPEEESDEEDFDEEEYYEEDYESDRESGCDNDCDSDNDCDNDRESGCDNDCEYIKPKTKKQRENDDDDDFLRYASGDDGDDDVVNDDE